MPAGGPPSPRFCHSLMELEVSFRSGKKVELHLIQEIFNRPKYTAFNHLVAGSNPARLTI